MNFDVVNVITMAYVVRCVDVYVCTMTIKHLKTDGREKIVYWINRVLIHSSSSSSSFRRLLIKQLYTYIYVYVLCTKCIQN